MAHIVNCIAEGDSGSITKPASPAPYPRSASACSNRAVEKVSTSSRRNSGFITPGEQPFTWRMQQQPPQTKRYQLFPRERQLPVLNSCKALDIEKASGMAPPQMEEKADKPTTTTSLKNKISQHSIIRRRKVSVPELGPMTTVHEVPMDSPTIPGRPPLHERSISAPADDWKEQPVDSFLDLDTTEQDQDSLTTAIEESFRSDSPKPGSSVSPRRLAPLVIPQGAAKPPQLLQKRAITHARSGSVPNEASKAGRTGDSPLMRTPYTPSTSMTDLSTPYTSSTHATSVMTLPTPISAPAGETHRFSPKPWEGRAITPTMNGRSMTPQPTASQPLVTPHNHRRGASESGSIMDRGRPRKRNERKDVTKPKAAEASLEKSAERQAFEELPKGFLPKDASACLGSEEVASVYKHAYRQAERFEVLKTSDVEALSKELRRLDERTDYLRRTYTSLRAGRRNLHARICASLRSPRVARFTCDSMLKQEEALAELDASIDDWVTKLEMAENRRTRVRQKLLEHVAAAAILQTCDTTTAASESLQQAMGLQSPGLCNISTPPRSPTKHASSSSRTGSNSPSPQRVVAQVPSTILEHPVVEDAEASGKQTNPETESVRSRDVESIRIYAGDDITMLLADVEKELTRISQTITVADPAWDDVTTEAEGPDLKRRQLNRERSHEMLNGLTKTTTITIEAPPKKHSSDNGLLDSPPAPPPPIKDYPRSRCNSPNASETTLTQAVFKG